MRGFIPRPGRLGNLDLAGVGHTANPQDKVGSGYI